ncbi:MAG TPA: glycosyltransferase family 39 protein [Anaerolineae bacterium]|nr:glycosyltransferase family 39 protein [Anaerolineae bacterium]
MRIYRLDAQSIWYDEGLSIYLAQLPPDQTIALSATTDHPPLHALLLGGWIRLAGDSDFSVRFLSVFFGVLAAALTYQLGRKFNERAGLIAACLISIAPMAVYYSQETRGYMLLTALILIAAIAFMQLLTGHEARWTWLIYSASIVGALYTHYFAAFAWLAFNVAYFVNFVYQELFNRKGTKAQRITDINPGVLASSRFALWFTVQLIIAVCFLPWLPNAITQAGSNATYFPGRVTWDTVVGDTWHAFTVGEWGGGSIASWVWVVLIAIGVLSSIWQFIRDRRTEAVEGNNWRLVLAFMLWLFIPIVLMSALAWFKPKFAPRYLLPSLPAFVVLGSIGFANFRPTGTNRFKLSTTPGGPLTRSVRYGQVGVPILCILALLFFDAQALVRQYSDPSIARPDIRSVVAYIQAHEQPADAIMLISGYQAPAFDHYYRGSNDMIPLPPDLLPAPQSPIDARSIATLADMAATYPRIWLVLWQNAISDPMDIIKDQLVERGRQLEVSQNFNGLGLQLFDVRAAKFASQPEITVAYAFVQPVKLVGYYMNTTRVLVGTSFSIGLYFSTDGSIQGNYQVFTHLVDNEGSIVAQLDHIAGADSYPTSLWQTGSLILNRFEIAVPNNSPPGKYALQIGLYDSTGRLKLIDGSDHVDLLTIDVVK